MGNKLQYVYSISVFIGVLVSSYFMMGRDSGGRSPLYIFQEPPSAREASVVDPAVNQMLQLEEALSRQYEQEEENTKTKREPTDLSRKRR